MSQPCRCRIVAKYKTGDDLDYKGHTISYCPKHQAVDELVEAVRYALAQMGIGPTNAELVEDKLSNALAKAEGKGTE